MSVSVSPKRCKKRNLRLLCKSQHRRLVTLPMISDLTPGPANVLAHTDTIFPWISFSLRDRVPNKMWHLSQVKWSKKIPDKLNIWVQSYKRRIGSQESQYFFLEKNCISRLPLKAPNSDGQLSSFRGELLTQGSGAHPMPARGRVFLAARPILHPAMPSRLIFEQKFHPFQTKGKTRRNQLQPLFHTYPEVSYF